MSKKFFAFLVLIIFFLNACSNVKEATKSYPTKDECEKATNCECAFSECDYIPSGKTFEEVCGINYTPGFMCIEEALANNPE